MEVSNLSLTESLFGLQKSERLVHCTAQEKRENKLAFKTEILP